jgi:hypothetical protein
MPVSCAILIHLQRGVPFSPLGPKRLAPKRQIHHSPSSARRPRPERPDAGGVLKKAATRTQHEREQDRANYKSAVLADNRGVLDVFRAEWALLQCRNPCVIFLSIASAGIWRLTLRARPANTNLRVSRSVEELSSTSKRDAPPNPASHGRKNAVFVEALDQRPRHGPERPYGLLAFSVAARARPPRRTFANA